MPPRSTLIPIVMGYSNKKESNRQPKRQRRQESEYGRQLREKQKAKFIYRRA